MSISVTLFFSVIVLFIAIIFFILIINSKPSERHTAEIKEVGWELVNEIKKEADHYYEKVQMERKKLEDEIKNLKEMKKVVEYFINEEAKKNRQQDLVQYMYENGYQINEIATILKMKKGEVELAINISKNA